MKNAAITLALFVALFFGISKGVDFFAARGATDNHLQVAANAVSEYEMKMRSGDTSAACFRAGMAASAYLSAKAESEHRKWQAVYDACK